MREFIEENAVSVKDIVIDIPISDKVNFEFFYFVNAINFDDLGESYFCSDYKTDLPSIIDFLLSNLLYLSLYSIWQVNFNSHYFLRYYHLPVRADRDKVSYISQSELKSFINFCLSEGYSILTPKDYPLKEGSFVVGQNPIFSLSCHTSKLCYMFDFHIAFYISGYFDVGNIRYICFIKS